MCVDAGIAVALHPCGHVCLCVACAHRLCPRLCPLCRAPIGRVDVLPPKAPPENRRVLGANKLFGPEQGTLEDCDSS